MVGYRLHNAMTEHGSVARGVCELRDGYLTGITERTHIEKRGDDAAFTEDGEHFTPLSGDTTVSMNFWGFTPWIFGKLEEYFATFLKGLAPDAIKAECLLPVFVDKLMHEGELTVPMLTTDAVWFGVTYKEDKPFVQAELRKLHESGVYPASLHE